MAAAPSGSTRMLLTRTVLLDLGSTMLMCHQHTPWSSVIRISFVGPSSLHQRLLSATAVNTVASQQYLLDYRS